MKPRQILLLLVSAAILIVLAALSGKRREAPAVAQSGSLLLPGLELNRIAAVEVAAAGKALRLARVDERWCVTNAYNYPADFARLSQRLIALRDIKIGQVQRGMTLDADRATQVRLLGQDDRPLATLTLGDARQARGGGDEPMRFYRSSEGRYLSRNDDPGVFLVKESLDDWSTDAEGWMDTQITSIPATDIASIELRSADGEAVVLDRTSGSLALVGLDAATETFDSSRASGIDTALSYLRFTRLADPSLTEDQLGFATGSLYRVTLKGGDIYTARLGAGEADGRYFRIAAELPPATTNDAARAAAETRVAEANARLEPWTFVIASYSAANMVRTRGELAKAKPAETNATEMVTAPAAAEAAPAAPAAPAAKPAAAEKTPPVAAAPEAAAPPAP
jgi:hypothetical protein